MKLKRQKPVIGGRDSLPSCVIKEIKREVEKDSHKFRVSKSWVVAVILAEHYKIQIEDFQP